MLVKEFIEELKKLPEDLPTAWIWRPLTRRKS